MTLQAVAAILTNQCGAVLLLQRDNHSELNFAGWWTLPGGQVEDDESPIEAAYRELQEEIEVTPELTLWRSYRREQYRPLQDEIVSLHQHIYIGEIDTPATEIRLHEGQGCAYFALTDLDKLQIAYGFDTLLKEFFMTQQTTVRGLEALKAVFEQSRSEGRAAFLPYFPIGFPIYDDSIAAIEAMANVGVDGFEIGVPFSDPLADGPVIQEATQIALKNGTTVKNASLL